MNTFTFKLLSLLGLSVLILVGCSTKPPSCSDEKNIALVKQILWKSLTEKQNEPGEDASLLGKMKQDVKLVVSAIRTAATDEKIGKVTCDAVLEAHLPPTAKVALDNPILRNAIQRDPSTSDLKINGLILSADIQYTSQMTDDKKEHLVEMRGFRGIVDLVSALGNMGVFKAADVAPKASATDIANSTSAAIVKRRMELVTLQGFECGDYCHLKFMDSTGNTQSAICMQVKECQSWMAEPKNFVPMIGKKATLDIGQQMIPQANAMMDTVTALTVLDVASSAPNAAAAAPTPTTAPSAAVPAAVAPSQASSPLCVAGEQAIFGCSTGKKQIAVCAAGGSITAATVLTYRIAPTGQSAEMTYPSPPTAAKSAFKRGSETYTGDKSMSYLSFDKGDIRYVAYSASGKAFDKAGVAVEQGGKRIASLVCSADLIDRLDALEKAGIPTDTRSFVLP